MRFRRSKKSPFKIFLSFFALFLLGCFVYSFIEANLLEAKTTVIHDSDVPQNFVGKKIVFASDFHLDEFTSSQRLAATVRKINALNPDIIVLGGDYVTDDKKFLAPAFAELKQLHAPLGVYGVTGNHDSVADYRLTVKEMKAAGIIPLENSSREIEIGGEKIRLGGVKTSYGEESDAEPTTEDTRLEDFIILVSHNPDFVEELHTDRIDLMLSGHTHGGQVTLFGLWAPYIPSDYGQKYMKGIVTTGGIPVYISNGVGTSALPIRFFAPPQIDELILEK
jgi:predicted MPP superfamily phosphohydrolase